MFERAEGDEAKTWRFQYVAIEEELEQSFRFVHPTDDNLNTYSIKYAEIIRSAANAFEILARELYARFYNDTDALNIYNYLALNVHLQFAHHTIIHLAALGTFPTHPEMVQPFAKLIPWDKASAVNQNHVPEWWTAYNNVKHSNAGLRTNATFANAVAAVGALFILIERVFGFGVLQGGFWNVPHLAGMPSSACMKTRWSRLFSR